ncbi:MAG: hypothetical protein ACREJO_14355 [Phycisphaerales bacterium]
MPDRGPPVILCPMQVEERAVRRALNAAARTSSHDAPATRVLRTGIGKDRITACVRELSTSSTPPAAFILAGVCGGLTPTIPLPPIARIIDEHGHTWDHGIGFSPASPGGVVLIGVDRIVGSPADKADLARATGAAIVDMESHAFAALCESLGVPWSIVRGVSDTPDESLPPEVLGWLAPDGTTRTGRAVADMARKPWLIPHMVRVMRRSSVVLPLVASRAVEIALKLENTHNSKS